MPVREHTDIPPHGGLCLKSNQWSAREFRRDRLQPIAKSPLGLFGNKTDMVDALTIMAINHFTGINATNAYKGPLDYPVATSLMGINGIYSCGLRTCRVHFVKQQDKGAGRGLCLGILYIAMLPARLFLQRSDFQSLIFF